MKTYTVRKEVRTSVHCQLSCFADGAVINGVVRDLSATGWRASMDRPIPIGLEQSVFMTLRNGKDCYPVFIDSAIVRWAEGHEAACEITRIDELTRTRLTAFLKQSERRDVA